MHSLPRIFGEKIKVLKHFSQIDLNQLWLNILLKKIGVFQTTIKLVEYTGCPQKNETPCSLNNSNSVTKYLIFKSFFSPKN